MNKTILIIASILGALGVVLGAMGSYLLKDKLGIDGLKNYETAVRYQMYHVFALFIVSILSYLTQNDKNLINLFFLLGILFFSGSLYAITAGGVPAKSIWYLTPLGGIMFITGWVVLVWKLIVRL